MASIQHVARVSKARRKARLKNKVRGTENTTKHREHGLAAESRAKRLQEHLYVDIADSASPEAPELFDNDVIDLRELPVTSMSISAGISVDTEEVAAEPSDGLWLRNKAEFADLDEEISDFYHVGELSLD